MDLNPDHQQSRRASARLEILHQELLAPILSIEGHTELLKEQIEDTECLADLQKVESAASQTRTLVNKMLAAETKQRDEDQRDLQRSGFRHDLRNTVGAIAGYAEIILEELDDANELSADARTFLDNLLSDSDKLLQMLDTLFRAEHDFGEDSESTLNVDIGSVFDSFERTDKASTEVIVGRILVVDDNASNRNLLAHQLHRRGHEISTAPTGRQALDMIRESTPDLVLLDLFMPDMNGFEVLREIHEDASLRVVPVIVITGLSDKNAAVKCIEAGAFDILIKPVNPALLQARVNACLERKAWRDKEKEYQRKLEKSYTFIRKVFGRYMSDEIVREILDADEGMQLGGGKRQITIMMTDIRGFSVLSQELDPQDCVRILNNYFGAMTPLIQKYGGVINEFLGDAILALFGAPVASDDHAQQAVACALEMQQAMGEVNHNHQLWGLPSIETGIALNTGEVVVGSIGSENRSKYGVVGHHVNLTARIESFTVGGQVMASEYTISALESEVTIAKAMEVEAKGIRGRVKIHEITGIGAPYNLFLEAREQTLHTLSRALPVTFNRLSGKAIADEQVKGMLTAVAEGVAHLSTATDLELLTDLRMNITGYAGSKEDQVYSKVTGVIDRQSEQNKYIIRLTSAPLGARRFIRSMVEQDSPNISPRRTIK